MIQSFRDLIVWQKSMDLACEVPEIAAQLPRSEMYGLDGSLRALETLLLLVERRGLAQPESLSRALSLLGEVGRMLTVLYQRLSASHAKR